MNNITIQAYLDLEVETNTKHEYHNGEVFAMAGGTLRHGLICGNIFGEARQALKGTDCRVMNSEIKLYVEKNNCFLYPDTMIVCGDTEQSKREPNSVTNPIVIVEVLSPSSASYDRGDKFFFYRQLPSLQEYIIIEQEKCLIETYRKKANLWEISRFTLENENLYIAALDLSIPIREIYRDVDFAG